MSICPHLESEPVEVRDHRTGGTEIVARICRRCLDRLPAAWGCTDCGWAYGPMRKMLNDPCEVHR